MAFTSFAEFLKMGTHGIYVWSAYLLVIISLLTIHILTKLRHKRLSAQLSTLKNETQTP